MQVVWSKLTSGLEIFPVITLHLRAMRSKFQGYSLPLLTNIHPLLAVLVSEELIRRFTIFIDRLF